MLQFIPFLAGAAAGALITYIAKDRETQKRIREGADKVADAVEDGLDRATRAAKALTRPGSARIARDSEPNALE